MAWREAGSSRAGYGSASTAPLTGPSSSGSSSRRRGGGSSSPYSRSSGGPSGSWRDSAGGGGGPAGGSAAGGGGGGAGGSSSYQAVDHRYLSLCDRLQKELKAFSSSITDIKSASELVGTRRDSDANRHALNAAVGEGKKQTRAIAHMLKSEFTPFLNATDISRQERSQRKQQHQKYFKAYKDRVAAFQQVAETAAAREKEYNRAARRASSMEHSSDDEEAGLVGLQNMQQIEFNEALIEEREEGILGIHQAVQEVNEVMQDLAVIVEQQGQGVDTIELNVTEGHARVGKGVEHLDAAMKYQSKTRGKLVCLLVIVFAIALALTLVFLAKNHKL